MQSSPIQSYFHSSSFIFLIGFTLDTAKVDSVAGDNEGKGELCQGAAEGVPAFRLFCRDGVSDLEAKDGGKDGPGDHAVHLQETENVFCHGRVFEGQAVFEHAPDLDEGVDKGHVGRDDEVAVDAFGVEHGGPAHSDHEEPGDHGDKDAAFGLRDLGEDDDETGWAVCPFQVAGKFDRGSQVWIRQTCRDAQQQGQKADAFGNVQGHHHGADVLLVRVLGGDVAGSTDNNSDKHEKGCSGVKVVGQAAVKVQQLFPLLEGCHDHHAIGDEKGCKGANDKLVSKVRGLLYRSNRFLTIRLLLRKMGVNVELVG